MLTPNILAGLTPVPGGGGVTPITPVNFLDIESLYPMLHDPATLNLTNTGLERCDSILLNDTYNFSYKAVNCISGTCDPIIRSIVSQFTPPILPLCNGTTTMENITYVSKFNTDMKEFSIVATQQTTWNDSLVETYAPTCHVFMTTILSADIRYQGIYEYVPSGPIEVKAKYSLSNSLLSLPTPGSGSGSSPRSRGTKFFHNIEHLYSYPSGDIGYRSQLVQTFPMGGKSAIPFPITQCPAPPVPTPFANNADSYIIDIDQEPYSLLGFGYTKPLGSFRIDTVPKDIVPLWSGATNHSKYIYAALVPSSFSKPTFSVSTCLHYTNMTNNNPAPTDNSGANFVDKITPTLGNADPLRTYPSLRGAGNTLFVYSVNFTAGFEKQVAEIQIYDELKARMIVSFKESFDSSFTRAFSWPYDCYLNIGSCSFYSMVFTTGRQVFRSASVLMVIPPQHTVTFPSISNGFVTKLNNLILPDLSMTGVMINEQPVTQQLTVGITSLFGNIVATKDLQYPDYFSGSLKQVTFKPPFTFPSDMPTADFNINGANQQVYSTPNRDIANLDLTSPFVRVKMLPPSSSIKKYRLLVTMNDDVGIGENTCSVTVGDVANNGAVYWINSGSRASGNHSVGTYIIPIEYSEAHFCHSPITLTCADIRGTTLSAKSNEYCGNAPCNDITQIFSDIPTCNPSVTPVYRTRLSYFGYSFNGSDSININVVVSGTSTFNSGTVCLFEDFDNKIPTNGTGSGGDTQSCTTLQRSSIVLNPGTIVLRGTIIIPRLNVTKTYFFGLQYSIDQAQPTITLSSREIAYFGNNVAQGLQTYANNRVTIRNVGYQPFPTDVIVNIIQEAAPGTITIQVSKQDTGRVDRLKNATFVIRDDFNPQPLEVVSVTYNPQTILPYNVTTLVTWGNNVHVYVSSMCDFNDNCEEYPLFGYFAFIKITATRPDVVIANTLNNPSIRFSNMTIDVFAEQAVKFNVSLAPTNTMECSLNPILYITEIGSLDFIKFKVSDCNKVGGTFFYTGEMKLPRSWGLRGITASFWNVVDKYGYTTGFHSGEVMPTIIMGQVVHVDESVLDYYYKTINITGEGLVGAQFMLNNQLVTPTFPDPNTAIIPFGAFQPFLDKDNHITINNVEYVLDFFYCDSFDCSGHGTCIEETCHCNLPWSGEDCSINKNYTCPENCNGNGDCVDQNCMCHNGHAGPTCKLDLEEVDVDMDYNEDMSTAILGVSKVNDTKLTQDTKSVSYNISIVAIQEMSYDDSVANNITLDWKLASTTANSTKYTITNMKGQHASNTITLTIDKFMAGGQTVWANKTLNFQPNTIKYTVSFDGYNFTSQLNYIQIIFQTVSMGECTQQQNENITWGAASLQDMHYFVIPQHQMQCYGRFPTSVISDGRVMSISNKIISAAEPVQIATAVPFFKKSAAIDPDFSVLVSYNQANSNAGKCSGKSDDGRKPYVIPLIVVGCVIFVAVVGVVLYMALKRNIYVRHRLHLMRTKSNLGSTKRLDKL
ncbi:hypothetical protein SAMD00019534_089130 [Acytostelium subglobosum LB1]|uniref:hypothetical protein n=1 Tax=Acytostelium subglobosum LB1 TaxID=1410327 RepID=UPI000644BE09|nr:hypothetical protein SAMD00019534_089130 [Acytostelium subglobosum LB1]GAM25738.1 hypothetical protein SAMD00019534_089130 [Acytostelium subglobosum LB1]|eukprot:XP_012751256.1 hypothetical protein SAMD00019534_089130 [Acytostelium subglobosum LB1]